MKSFLLVDDSAIIRKLAKRMLAKHDYEFSEAENGAVALDICKSKMPSGILLDWNMPIMDGLAFIKQLRTLPGGDQPKVLFCTTECEMDKIETAMGAGADEFIMKPFDEEILSSKLELVGLA
jgi:two-component system chemotaxis response regulator CheY